MEVGGIMPIILNGSNITSNKINGSNVSLETLNGVTIYTGTVKSWSYLGTSGSYNGTATFSADPSITTCRTSTALISYLDALYPAYNYATGYIMRVLHYRWDSTFGMEIACTTYYYKVVES